MALHWPVVLALAGIATMTTVFFAFPALLVARTDPQPALQTASRGLGTRSIGARFSGWLVALEVAVSTLLLIATGLLFHTSLEPGTQPARFRCHARDLIHGHACRCRRIRQHGRFSDSVSQAPISVATHFYQPTLERLRQVPGVQDVALVTAPPLSGINMRTSFKLARHPNDPAHMTGSAHHRSERRI